MIGFHNWVYYAFLESRREVKYVKYHENYEPKVHTKEGKVSYNLHQGDQRNKGGRRGGTGAIAPFDDQRGGATYILAPTLLGYHMGW